MKKTTSYATSNGNFARTDVANGDGPQSANVLWDYDLPSQAQGYIPLVDGDPIVYDGNVYFSVWGSGGMSTQGSTGTTGTLKSVDGLYCLDANSGTFNWHNEDLPSRGGLAVNDGVIYGGTTENNHEGYLFAVYTNNSTRKWNTTALAVYAYTGIASSPLIYDDRIYVLTQTANNTDVVNSLFVFQDDGTSATQLAKIDLNQDLGAGVAEKFATASVSPGGTIYTPGKGGVVAINSTDYKINWVTDVGARGATTQGGNNKFVGTPVYKDQKVYFAATGSV